MNAAIWNAIPKSQGERLLLKAGHSRNLKYRSYDALYHNVKLDIEYVEQRQAKQEKEKGACKPYNESLLHVTH